MAPIRLIALDLDGTLLDDDKRLPGENAAAARAAEAAGIEVVICTGRMLATIEPVVDELGLDPVAAGYNGAKLFESRACARAVIEHAPIDARPTARLIDRAREHACLLYVYHEEQIGVTR